MPKTKKCFICDESFPQTREFFYDSTKHMHEGKPRRWGSYCIKCSSMYGVLYYKKDRLFGKEISHWSYTFRKKFENSEQLDSYFSDDKIECLLCGQEYKNLGLHISKGHKIPVRKYKKLFDIPLKYGLICPSTKVKCQENGSPADFLIEEGKKVTKPRLRAVRGIKVQHSLVSKKKLRESMRKARQKANLLHKKNINQPSEEFCCICGKAIIRTVFGMKHLEAIGKQPICKKCAKAKWKKNFSQNGYTGNINQRKGAPQKLTPEQTQKMLKLYKQKKATYKQISKIFNISRSSISNYIMRDKKNNERQNEKNHPQNS